MEKVLSGTAARILEKATFLLAKHGYQALSMRTIAKEAGISQAAIYRHYADKSALVDAVVAQGYESLLKLVEEMAAASARGTEPETLKSFIPAYIEFAFQRPCLFAAILLHDLGPSGIKIEAFDPGTAFKRKTFTILRDLISRGMESGTIAQADPELTAQAFWMALFGLAARLVIERAPEGGKRDALVARHAEILVRGLESAGTR